MTTKENIIKLREQGLSYREIEKQLKVGRGLIAYHLSDSVKAKHNVRQSKNRFLFKKRLRLAHGGKCFVCKYDRCFDALVFHHADPTQKSFTIGGADFSHRKSQEEIIEESKKCVLLCSNCHYEVHKNLITLNPSDRSFGAS